jgi:hypothetical protein
MGGGGKIPYVDVYLLQPPMGSILTIAALGIPRKCGLPPEAGTPGPPTGKPTQPSSVLQWSELSLQYGVSALSANTGIRCQSRAGSSLADSQSVLYLPSRDFFCLGSLCPFILIFVVAAGASKSSSTRDNKLPRTNHKEGKGTPVKEGRDGMERLSCSIILRAVRQ